MDTDRRVGQQRRDRAPGLLRSRAHGREGDVAQVHARADPTDRAIGGLTAEFERAALQGRGHHRHIHRRADLSMGVIVLPIEIDRALAQQRLDDLYVLTQVAERGAEVEPERALHGGPVARP
jgi:hypothetical protein